MKIFMPPFAPSPGTEEKPVLKLLKSDFGDGYSLHLPDGINNIKNEATLTWDLLLPDHAAMMNTFMCNRKGSDPFYYMPSYSTCYHKWTCEEWSRRSTDSGFMTFQARLTQTFLADGISAATVSKIDVIKARVPLLTNDFSFTSIDPLTDGIFARNGAEVDMNTNAGYGSTLYAAGLYRVPLEIAISPFTLLIAFIMPSSTQNESYACSVTNADNSVKMSIMTKLGSVIGRVGSTGGAVDLVLASVIPSGNLVHAGVVFNGATLMTGKIQGSSPVTSSNGVIPITKAFVDTGCSAGSNLKRLGTTIQDVVCFNRALSMGEIASYTS